MCEEGVFEIAEQLLVCFGPFFQIWSFVRPLILEEFEALSRWTLSCTKYCFIFI